jgi:hypothetical protein
MREARKSQHEKLDKIIQLLHRNSCLLEKLIRAEVKEMGALDDVNVALDGLVADVTVLKAGKDSAIGLLNGLAAKLDALIAAGGDPTATLAKVADLSAEIKATTDDLATAVVADTR